MPRWSSPCPFKTGRLYGGVNWLNRMKWPAQARRAGKWSRHPKWRWVESPYGIRGGETGCLLRDLIALSCQVARSVLSLSKPQNFALKVNGSPRTKPVKDWSLHQQAGKFVVRNITARWTRQNAVAGVPACSLLVGRITWGDKHSCELNAGHEGRGANGEDWARRKMTCIDTYSGPIGIISNSIITNIYYHHLACSRRRKFSYKGMN